MAHMDWHFRVHQRSSEAAKLGTHRTWYVDAQDWIKSREVLDSDDIDGGRDVGAQSGGSGGGGGGGGGSNPSQQTSKKADTPRYIPVPDASRGISNVCPICQDSFQNSWLDEVQEWVWLDGVIVNNRVYHASCRAATTRERETPPGLRRTPEPVLGKRKADVSLASPKVRSLKTSG
jgi:pre-mRNA cleavage complex 2 protein Pcf11